MEITHQVLVGLGFIVLPKRTNQYSYKGFRGVLNPVIGLFSFDGLSHTIAFMSDLKFLLMLIDFPAVTPALMYPGSDN